MAWSHLSSSSISTILNPCCFWRRENLWGKIKRLPFLFGMISGTGVKAPAHLSWNTGLHPSKFLDLDLRKRIMPILPTSPRSRGRKIGSNWIGKSSQNLLGLPNPSFSFTPTVHCQNRFWRGKTTNSAITLHSRSRRFGGGMWSEKNMQWALTITMSSWWQESIACWRHNILVRSNWCHHPSRGSGLVRSHKVSTEDKTDKTLAMQKRCRFPGNILPFWIPKQSGPNPRKKASSRKTV